MIRYLVYMLEFESPVSLFLPTQVMTLMSVLYPTSASKCVPTLRDHSPVDVRQDMCWTVMEHLVLVIYHNTIAGYFRGTTLLRFSRIDPETRKFSASKIGLHLVLKPRGVVI